MNVGCTIIRVALKRLFRLPFLAFLLVFALGAAAQDTPPNAPKTVLILPFENVSKAPGLDWIGEAFPEVLGERLSGPDVYCISRDDRQYAFDRAAIPASLRPSRATLYRIAEQMDADYMLMGTYSYDGQTFTARAQWLDLKKLRLSREVSESGPLVNLMDTANAVAWKVLRALSPERAGLRSAFLSSSPSVRLDAFENYIRGVTASTREEKVQRFKQALKLNPQYEAAILQLGKTYFKGRDYRNAATWLAKMPRTSASAGEASFYLGLASYYTGDFSRAEEAFKFLLSRLPLTEVYNNLAVAQARRGKATAAEYFQKAVDADPNDPDYRFNLAVEQYRAGAYSDAVRQLREALRLRPSDSEARQLYDELSANPNAVSSKPLERIKRNYDETSFRQLALEIEKAQELTLEKRDPASHARAHVDRGRDLLSEGFAAEAAAQFREALSFEPKNAGAHSGLAAALFATGEDKGARQEAETSLRLQPNAEAFVVLGRLEFKANNLPQAEADADRALALEPTNSAAITLKHEVTAKPADTAEAVQR